MWPRKGKNPGIQFKSRIYPSAKRNAMFDAEDRWNSGFFLHLLSQELDYKVLLIYRLPLIA